MLVNVIVKSKTDGFPLMSKDRFTIADEFLTIIKQKYPVLYQELTRIDCERGWFPLINKLSGIIENELKKREIKDVYVEQVKEKFGGLRFYMNKTTDFNRGAIALAREMSHNICEECAGRADTHLIGDYYTTLCSIHADDARKEFKKEVSDWSEDEL